MSFLFWERTTEGRDSPPRFSLKENARVNYILAVANQGPWRPKQNALPKMSNRRKPERQCCTNGASLLWRWCRSEHPIAAIEV
jgi:hypothetical protein